MNDPDPSDTIIEASSQNNEQSPLLSSSSDNGSGVSNISKHDNQIFPYKSNFTFNFLFKVTYHWMHLKVK